MKNINFAQSPGALGGCLWLVVMLALLVPWPAGAAVQNRTALVIGNGDYQDLPLKNPTNDASDVAKALAKAGFEVIHKENVDQQAMEDAIREFGKALSTRGGTGLFYYAGHGVQLGDANYLIPLNSPIEVEKDVKYKAVNAAQVLDEMEYAGNPLNIVILDACRNNPYASSFRSASRGLVRMDGPRGSLIAYATSPGSVADDGDGRNSVYTKHLLAAIEQPGQPIEQVFKQVRVGVSQETGGKQVPWESSSLTGDFFFLEPGTTATPAPRQSQQPARSQSEQQVASISSAPAMSQVENIREERIKLLLAAAELDVKALRLTSPEGNNALERYQEVLSLDPGNAEAESGIETIAERYVAMIDSAIAKGQVDKANRYLGKARSLKPSSEIVAAAEARLAGLSGDTALDESSPGEQGADDVRAQKEAESVQVASAKPAEQIALGGSARKVFRDELVSGGKGPAMITIPPGTFRMGDLNQAGQENERPVQTITFSKPFAVGKFEVTFEEYDKFAQVTGRPLPPDNGWGRGARPVVNINWYDARAYVDWLSQQTGHKYRLPSEAEWEYVARAGTTTEYWWGNHIGRNQANCEVCGSQWDAVRTAPVGSFGANPFGVHDTVGNVWEWTEDCHHQNHEGARSDGKARTGGRCDTRVLRGGAWNYMAPRVRASTRSSTWPESQYLHLGFRVARDL